MLKDNTPTHYCFFKEIKEIDFECSNKTSEENHEDFLYAKIKQGLKIDDLRRYGIHAILIDDYPKITEILKAIEIRIKRKNIFISGAAETYNPLSKEIAEKLIYDLSYKLAEKGFRIVSGFGLGIGSLVINGALQYKLNSSYRNLDDLLLLRPFPQINCTPETYTQYRNEMLSQAGIALFLFGNKLDKNTGTLIDSTGMLEEFELCLKNKVIPIPIGATGYVSKKLWDRVTNKFNDFYPENNEFKKAIEEIGKTENTPDIIIQNTLKAINLLQKA
ncbi:hypothetical protein [Acinetobacter terrestris]|uniref:hypothetical protein n=1 Tax=Acinetobacter terrestris TaxID=2529843 RepID=UPI001BE4CDCC|nr:hypothetical protein [Acinetobacter terrestris]